MKIRLAKKILFSRLYFKKHQKLRPPYINEDGYWTWPSWHDLPDVKKAKTRYYKWLGIWKRQ